MWSRLTKWLESRKAIRDAHLEGLLHAMHLQPGHYYLFIYECHAVSQFTARALSNQLGNKGIDNGFLRIRGIPPVVYDLKRPEDPVKGIENE